MQPNASLQDKGSRRRGLLSTQLAAPNTSALEGGVCLLAVTFMTEQTAAGWPVQAGLRLGSLCTSMLALGVRDVSRHGAGARGVHAVISGLQGVWKLRGAGFPVIFLFNKWQHDAFLTSSREKSS